MALDKEDLAILDTLDKATPAGWRATVERLSPELCQDDDQEVLVTILVQEAFRRAEQAEGRDAQSPAPTAREVSAALAQLLYKFELYFSKTRYAAGSG